MGKKPWSCEIPSPQSIRENYQLNRGSKKLPQGEKTMAYITTHKDWEELENTLVDEETGMTQADWIEWQYDGDITFID